MKSPSDRVRASAAWITAHATEVSVDNAGCARAAQFLQSYLQAASSTGSWCGAGGLHPAAPNAAALDWIFVVDNLNFCFRVPGVVSFAVEYKGKEYKGYWALCASVNRALDEGIPLTTPAFYATVGETQMRHVFRSASGTDIPLLAERVANLNEAGAVLQAKFDGSVASLVARANGDAQELVELIVSNFSSFADSISLEDAAEELSGGNGGGDLSVVPELAFYKRAQILVADIWACFGGKGLGQFPVGLDRLTMFADYRVPQILVWLGALQYAAPLMDTLRKGTELARGSRREIEIRGCSITAVEEIRRELERLAEGGKGDKAPVPVINSIVIDFALWDYAAAHLQEMDDIPVHYVQSIYY